MTTVGHMLKSDIKFFKELEWVSNGKLGVNYGAERFLSKIDFKKVNVTELLFKLNS